MNGVRVSVVERACTALTGTTPVEVRRAAAGPRTAVYRVLLADGRHTVVKVFAADTAHGADDEARLLRAVAASGRISVPTVIAHGLVPGHRLTALITEDVGMQTLGGAMREGQMPRAAALLRLALLMTAFHSIQPTPGIRLAPTVSEQVSAVAGHCPPPVFAQLAPALEIIARGTTAQRLVWCHGDLHFDNAVLGSGRHHPVAGHLPEHVVDFEAATFCVPEYDLAQTLVTCDALDPADRIFLAAAYGRPVDLHLLDAYVAFQAVCGWTYAAHREGRDQDAWTARLHKALTPEPLRERTYP